MPFIIKKPDKELERQVSKLGSQMIFSDEPDELDAKIVSKIRLEYSTSRELALHRKKLLGIVDEEEWQTYVDYVVKCIEEAKKESD